VVSAARIVEDRGVFRGVAFVAGSLAVATLAAALVAVVTGAPWSAIEAPALKLASGVLFFLGVAVPACVGWGLVLRRPRERVAWVLLAGAFSVALVLAADGTARELLRSDPDSTSGAWALLVAQEWLVLFAWPLALAYWFPNGALPSARWRAPAVLAAVSCGGAMLLLLGQDPLDGPSGPVANPLGISLDEASFAPVFWVLWGGVLVSLLGGVLALGARYRAGGPAERRQVSWLAYGALLLPLWLGGTTLIARIAGATPGGDVPVIGLLHAWLAVAVAVAVTRHGLYEIDRLFNRTLVYALLTALLAATYGTVAVVAGQLVGESVLAASLGTLAAAIAFRPLRDRVQREVDRRFARARFEGIRLVRGFLDDVRDGRAEPEEVGAVLAVALDDPTAEVLFRLPETGAYADRRGAIVHALPADGRARTAIGRRGLLLHDAALADRPDLLRGVLEVASVAVELARLRVELRLQLAEVESSRARIARAGYEERRRLERDLHDGAQQRLVTLGIVLRRIQRSLPREAKVLEPSFDAAVGEVAATIADLRTLAAGVRPARLDEGLGAALEDLARGAAVPVEVQTSGERAPPDVEAAAYFIASEALTNAVKHGAPSHVTLRTSRDERALRLVVSDDGVGGAAADVGSGLAGMADRVAAQGGRLEVHSPSGGGTRIEVELPCAS
jgi:signal transduction histidine kinase